MQDPRPSQAAAAAGADRGLGRTLLAAILAAGPAAILFAPSLGFPFLSLDDVHAVTTNPGIRSLSLDGLRTLFLEDRHEMRYFPLTYLSFAIDYRLFGLDPFGYHLTNLGLHLANTLGVFAVVLALTRDRIAAGVAGALFGIHPLQVESVAWVTSRKNVLFLFFFLASVLAYLRHVRGREAPDGTLGGWQLASAGLYVAACLSKTTAITLPGVLVAVDYWRGPVPARELPGFLWRSVSDKLPHWVGALLVLAASAHFSSENPFATEYAFTRLEWLLIAGHNLTFYVAKTLLPVHLGVFYPLPEPGALPTHFVAFALLAVALLSAFAFALARCRRVVVFGLGWYLATILPLCVFAAWFSDIPILAADRYHYQSLIGLTFLAGVGVSAGVARGGLVRAGTVAALLAAGGGLFAVAADYLRAWSSSESLYRATLAHHPNDEFYYRLAAEYMATGRRALAFEAATRAREAERQIFFLRLCAPQLRLADIHRQMGEPLEAARFVAAAIDSTPNFFEAVDARTPFAYAVLADLYARAGRPAEAAQARAAGEAARVDPRNYFAANWLRLAPDDSQALLERRLRADPGDGMPWYYLGLLASLTGDVEASRQRLARAAALGFPGERLGAAPEAHPGPVQP